jgi:outer membrane cobalamin receptor
MHFPPKRLQTILLVLSLGGAFVLGQTTEDLMKLDIEDIMAMDISVFSVQGLTQRQTPGVLTVIDEEEIGKSGARDLIDVLRLVPGFDFGVDVQSAVGLGVRGLWAQEGKVLLLVDGLEMNEIRFSCLGLGDHFPVEHIRRIEIIRGPGTSFYGGYAELAVINIITKGAVDLAGVEATASLGATSRALSRSSISLNVGRKFGALKFKALSYFSRSLRSDRDYTDVYGNGYSMRDHSTIRPLFINAAAEIHGLEAQLLVDRYDYDMQDGMGDIIGQTFGNAFNALIGKIRYEREIARGWTLSPYAAYLRQEPWKTVDPLAKDPAYDWYSYVIAERTKAGLTLKGSFGEAVQIVAGAEAFRDKGTMTSGMPEDYWFGNGTKKSIAFNQAAVFAQAFYTKGNTIPSIGLRYDRHNLFGAEFLPWVGVTQILGKWSLKALVGRTFRAPTLENLDMNPKIKPEKTTTGELELGYQAGENLFFILDFFRTRISGPIVYFYDPSTEEEFYGNYGKVGSQGVEAEAKVKTDGGFINAGYSFYRPTDRIDSYRVDGRPDLFLGFPAHKITLNNHNQLTPRFGLTQSVVWLSPRYGAADHDSEGNTVQHGLGSRPFTWLVNLTFQYSNCFGTDCDLGFGVYNLLDQEDSFMQPYDSGHAPLPWLSREFVVNLKARWKK